MVFLGKHEADHDLHRYELVYSRRANRLNPIQLGHSVSRK